MQDCCSPDLCPQLKHSLQIVANTHQIPFTGGKTITAIKLLPKLDTKKPDENALGISLPGDLPTGAYDIEFTDPQANTFTMDNAIEVTAPAFGKQKLTMEDLEKAMKHMKNQ